MVMGLEVGTAMASMTAGAPVQGAAAGCTPHGTSSDHQGQGARTP